MDRTASPPVEPAAQHTQADTSPPSRPSRTNIEDLTDFFNSQLTTTTKRPITLPAPTQSPSKIGPPAGQTKTKEGTSNFASDLLGSNQIEAIGLPNDPVRFTHLGFNTPSGDLSGLPKEWKQLLRMSGISRVASSILDGMGVVIDPPRDEADWSSGEQNPVSRLAAVAYVKDPQWLVQVPRWRPTQCNVIRTFTTRSTSYHPSLPGPARKSTIPSRFS